MYYQRTRNGWQAVPELPEWAETLPVDRESQKEDESEENWLVRLATLTQDERYEYALKTTDSNAEIWSRPRVGYA
jgi:hypothetical protein